MLQNLQNFTKFQKVQLDNLVDFEKCMKTRIYLQRSAPIQRKTSEILPKICQKIGNYPTGPEGSWENGVPGAFVGLPPGAVLIFANLDCAFPQATTTHRNSEIGHHVSDPPLVCYPSCRHSLRLVNVDVENGPRKRSLKVIITFADRPFACYQSSRYC